MPDHPLLDKLDQLHEAGTPGPWFRGADESIDHHPLFDGSDRTVCDFDRINHWREDRDLIVALHNHWPEVSRVLRECLEALEEYADPLMYEWDINPTATGAPDDPRVNEPANVLIDNGTKARQALTRAKEALGRERRGSDA